MYLKTYVTGVARDAISGSLNSAAPNAYCEAIKTLDLRFGSPLVISAAYLERLENWPVVGYHDTNGLRKLPQ